MKSNFSLTLISSLAICCFAEPSLRVTTDKDALAYKSGDSFVTTIEAIDCATLSPAGIRVTTEFDGAADAKVTILPLVGNKACTTNRFEKAGMARMRFALVDSNEHPIRTRGSRMVACTQWIGASINSIPEVPRIEDFETFWAEIKAEADAVDLSKATLMPVSDKVQRKFPDFNVWQFCVPIPATSKRPATQATGYLASHRSSKEGTLSAQVYFMDYGVFEGREPVQNMGQGILIATINAHGFKLDEPDSYYISLDALISTGGEGGGYGYKSDENRSPKTSYFYGMILRDLVAIRYIKNQKLWNGKSLVVQGRGQGAFQALACAAVDKSISRAEISKPWLSDIGGAEHFGRIQFGLPPYTDGLRYFDCVQLYKKVACPVNIAPVPLNNATYNPTSTLLLRK